MSLNRFSRFTRFACIALCAGMLYACPAAADLIEPQQTIENASNQLKQRLQEPGFIHDFHKINDFVNEVIYPHIDFDLISSLVLGKSWKEATVEQKASFKKEFQLLLIRTYARALYELKDWSVRFLPVNNEEDPRKVMIKTEILQPGLQPISINYRMLHGESGWKVYDIIIEGVSLVTNYRTGFKNDVERSGGSLQQVIDQLARKNQEALNAPQGDNKT